MRYRDRQKRVTIDNREPAEINARLATHGKQRRKRWKLKLQSEEKERSETPLVSRRWARPLSVERVVLAMARSALELVVRTAQLGLRLRRGSRLGLGLRLRLWNFEK